MKLHSIALSALLLGTLAGGAQADGLYPVQAAPSLFSDVKARQVGDVLTIVVSEQTTAVSAATTKTSKSEEASFSGGNVPLLRQLGKLGASGSGKVDASGTTARNGSLTGQITVRVKSVEPNGNLVIEGVRDVTINAEKQKMTFTGRVRAVDVASDNTIASALVADATIVYEGKGPVGNKQHDGIITRIFKVLF